MTMNLEKITIKGLFGYRDMEIQLQDNSLILVGENGSGKTTILRILFYILSGKWAELSKVNFRHIAVKISGNTYNIDSEDLKEKYPDYENIADIPMRELSRLKRKSLLVNHNRLYPEIDILCKKYGVSRRSLLEEIGLHYPYSEKDNFHEEYWQNLKKIQQEIDAQILYLPTYRRIERELSSIIKGMDSDDFPFEYRNRYFSEDPDDINNSYIELVEFGMKDVEKSIENTLSDLKDFVRTELNKLTLNYLGDVLDKKYDEVNKEAISKTSPDKVHNVVDRIDENILSTSNKQNLIDVIQQASSSGHLTERSKIICHYFMKLLQFQNNLQDREKQISKFCELCSEYIEDKQFLYDSANFSFSIISKNLDDKQNTIQLKDLSSGEKQIVSLFSHLYLSGNTHYFVIIDEPELSLSVPWQRRFLADIYYSNFCTGVVAATHSPFIYENKLEQYTHAVGEFEIGGWKK
ncbi:hypothetical protein BKM01_05850 [Methanohalophilus portucalensis]|nr:hypothetical protein BKM01_05850 [Methanohalophilus portucalensis]SMH34723.1 AAA ATPase domain-containing protein [Methanohalophilus portucalensis FDF-1]